MTGEPRGFSRGVAGFSNYDGEFRNDCPGWKSHISGTFWFEKKKMLRAEGRGSVTAEDGAEPAGHLTEQDIDSFLTLGSKEE